MQRGFYYREPGFIGFGIALHNDILWPPNKPKNSPDWSLVSDLRLFGEKGEWHVWRDWDRKPRCRLLEFTEEKWHLWLGSDAKGQDSPEKSGEKTDVLTEYHFLWGTKRKKSEHSDWIKLVEDRGAEIWLPLAGTEFDLKESDLPLRLKLKQIIDYDPKTHLAGITDAALVGLTRESKEVIFPPTSVSSS